MDGASIARLRWRLHGAWMWPAFVVLTLADGAIVHWLPLSGDRESAFSGWLVGFFLSLLGIILISPPLGRVLRRFRPDMPKVVARDYAGAMIVATISLILLVAGLLHHATVTSDQHALEDAVARAEAYIGAKAPRQFRVNMDHATTFVVQSHMIYRTCVPNRQGTRAYCVIVHRDRPFGRSVSYAGSEPNSVLSQGTG